MPAVHEPAHERGGGITVQPLLTPAQMRAGVALYRDVFELALTDPAVSPRLLAALQRNGGTVLGAFAGETLVGFAYGFLGRDAETGEVYHYSQLAVVARAWQGRGVGRALKLAQRDHVLRSGIRTMRWAYDPLRAHNAHFNLDVLGARGRWFVPDMYGVEDMGRDAGLRSDRVVVEWDLTREPARQPELRLDRPPAWGERAGSGPDVLVAIPCSWPDLVRADPARAQEVRDRVGAVLGELIPAGYAAVSCQVVTPDTAVYRLEAPR